MLCEDNPFGNHQNFINASNTTSKAFQWVSTSKQKLLQKVYEIKWKLQIVKKQTNKTNKNKNGRAWERCFFFVFVFYFGKKSCCFSITKVWTINRVGQVRFVCLFVCFLVCVFTVLYCSKCSRKCFCLCTIESNKILSQIIILVKLSKWETPCHSNRNHQKPSLKITNKTFRVRPNFRVGQVTPNQLF